MKKLNVFISAVFFLLYTGSFAAEGDMCSSTGEAEDRWKNNRQAEALKCLDEIIAKDPANTRAQFLKGKYCLAMENYECMRERFIAGPVRAEYGNEIAGLYRSAGDAKLKAGYTQEAEAFYRESSAYVPAVRMDVARKLFTSGKQTGNDESLSLAGRLDPSLNKAISNYYYSLSKTAKGKEARVDMLAKAAQFDNSKDGEYRQSKEKLGRFHLKEARKFAGQAGKDEMAAKHKVLARKYLGDEIVNKELPEGGIKQTQ